MSKKTFTAPSKYGSILSTGNVSVLGHSGHFTSKNQSSLEVVGKAVFKDKVIVEGVDLMEALAKIEKRLGILRTNSELEKQFQELKDLGDQYRKLEKECSEKWEIWNVLQQPNDDDAA
jgi:hypothetical protein